MESESVTEKAASDIDAKVSFLKKRSSYTPQPLRVEFRETHMAWVFLVGRFAYKLKKPVLYDYLDFSTLEARRLSCLREVRLNRRLAPNVYLGMVPLCSMPKGVMQIGGAGHVIDWLVKMRRLPAERMLDFEIRHGTVVDPDVDEAGRLLCEFYRRSAPIDMPPGEYRRRLAGTIEHDRRKLVDPLYDLPRRQVDGAAELQLSFIDQRANLLDERVRDGRIIDAHGDLRPEHVCLEHPPVIIDCLEFSTDLRTLDMASDLSFLTLECELLDAKLLGKRFWRIYSRTTGDVPAPELLQFYRASHAFSRSKVAIRHLDDAEVNNADKWKRKALRYLEIANERDGLA